MLPTTIKLDVFIVGVEEYLAELEIVQDIESTADQHNPKAWTSWASLSQFLVMDDLKLEVYVCVHACVCVCVCVCARASVKSNKNTHTHWSTTH